MIDRRRPRIVIAVLLVVLGAAVAWKLRCQSGQAHDDGGRRGSNLTTPTAGGGRTGAVTPTQPASLSGRVTRKSDGTGIAGAVVAIARSQMLKELAADDQPSTVVTTDAMGAWTVPAIGPSTYTISAVAVGFVPELREKLVVSAGSHTAIDLALADGGTTIAGIVSDVGGGPIGGARVTLRRDAFVAESAEIVALTGPDGRYQVSLADGGYTAIASHDDYTAAQRSFELQGERLAVDFVLTPGGQIRGQVVSRDGQPMPGAIVHANGGRTRGGGQSVADDTGNFAIKSLGSGAISLSAAGRGFASASPTIVALGIGEQVEGVGVVVDRAFSISGRVVRAGKPTEGVPGVGLGVFSMNGQRAQAIAPSDATGAFEIIGVKPASYTMFAVGEAVVPEIGKSVNVIDKDITDLVIEMATGATLTGRVEPGAIASLSLASTSDRIGIGIGNVFEPVKVGFVHGESDATGAFTLRSVPPGAFNVVAQTSDGRLGKLPVTVAAADQTGLVVKLEPRASLAGRVVDANGAPVAGVHVQVHSDREPMGGMKFSMAGMSGGVITGTTGAFRAVGLEAGKLSVYVTDDQGQIPWARRRDEPRTFELTKGQDMTGVTLEIEARDGVIRGLVVGSDRAPVADAWVTPRIDAKAEPFLEISRFMNPAQPILTGADGTFTIERLRRGTYELTVEGPRGASRAKKTGVKTGDTVTLVLEPLGTLSGRVTVNGAPVPAFELDCNTKSAGRFDSDGGGHERRFTNGTYTLERLVPGDYACTATSEGGSGSGKVTITTGPVQLDLALAPWASVGGSLVSVFDGKPMPGLAVVASVGTSRGDAFEAMFTGKAPRSDANGQFLVERVAAGKTKLIVMPLEGFHELATREFTTTSGQRVDLGAIKIVPPRTGDAGTLGLSLAHDDGGKLTVASVMPEGPAELAGVARGDRVVSIDGKPVTELGFEIAQGYLFAGSVAVGQRVQLGLEREAKPLSVTLVAAKW